MCPETSARPGQPLHYLIALGLAAFWFLVLACLSADFLRGYFPLGDEFALLANSYPGLGQPLHWLTEGFSRYFIAFPELTVPSTNFIRPVFNLTYWLVGWFAPPTSGVFLYVNLAVLAACSGLMFLALQRSVPVLFALLLAAALPLAPAFLPSVGVLLVPCQAFDPMAAFWCLLAYLAYRDSRLWLCALWLTLAVFTKETALPVAAALCVAYVLDHRHDFLRKERLLGFLVLLAPLLLWLIVRALVFTNMTGGVYVFNPSLRSALAGIVHNIERWPFWFSSQSPQLRGAGWIGLAMLVVNAGMLVAGALLCWRRWQQRRLPNAAEICLLFSYLFMVLVGNQERLGAVLSTFLILSAGLWIYELRAVWLGRVLALLLGIGLAGSAWQGWQSYQPTVQHLSGLHNLARRYVDTLHKFPSGARVIVMNDPATMTTPPDMLARVTGVQATVEKLSDYVCPWSLQRLQQDCSTSLQQMAAGQYAFHQNCGLELCSAAPGIFDKPLAMGLPSHAAAHYFRSANTGTDPGISGWDSISIDIPEGNAYLVWYDPASDQFRQQHVPSLTGKNGAGQAIVPLP